MTPSFTVDWQAFLCAFVVCSSVSIGSLVNPMNQSFTQSINQSVDESINESINQSIIYFFICYFSNPWFQSSASRVTWLLDQSTNQSINQSINQSANQSIRLSISQCKVDHGFDQSDFDWIMDEVRSINRFDQPTLALNRILARI